MALTLEKPLQHITVARSTSHAGSLPKASALVGFPHHWGPSQDLCLLLGLFTEF